MPHWSRICVVLRGCFLFQKVVGFDPLISSVLRGHEGTVSAVTISPDNHWLLTGGNEETARLWDLTAKDPSASAVVLRGYKGTVSAVAISPDNHWLVTGSTNHSARRWPLQVNDLMDLARVTVGRNFTTKEWKLYFHDEPYHRTFSDLPGATLPKPHLEFSYEYSFPDSNGSGPRKWLKITDDDWIQRFPNGVENKLRRQGSEVVDGDLGTVFVLLRDPDLLYFVPDMGSAILWIRDRRVSAGDGKWSFLGKMVFPAN
jgi:WD40 repeat protein